MDIRKFFSKENGKETAVAAGKASIPACIATALLSGVGAYLGIDLPVEGLVGIFFGAQLGNLVGQFQRNPKDVVRRFSGLFDKE
jgi:hypothetical protein